jgi:thymidylate kinase
MRRYAYQGAGAGSILNVIDMARGNAVHADLWPHRTLLLDLPVDRLAWNARAARAGRA